MQRAACNILHACAMIAVRTVGVNAHEVKCSAGKRVAESSIVQHAATVYDTLQRCTTRCNGVRRSGAVRTVGGSVSTKCSARLAYSAGSMHSRASVLTPPGATTPKPNGFGAGSCVSGTSERGRVCHSAYSGTDYMHANTTQA